MVICWHHMALLVVIIQVICISANDVTDYPEKSLQCYSFFTKPDMKLICPAARNNYCVKEVSTMQSDTCGDSDYFGDMYVKSKGECQLKKCSDVCVEETIQFVYNYETYSRSRYCCKSDLCNSGFQISSGSRFALGIMILVAVVLYLT